MNIPHAQERSPPGCEASLGVRAGTAALVALVSSSDREVEAGEKGAYCSCVVDQSEGNPARSLSKSSAGESGVEPHTLQDASRRCQCWSHVGFITTGVYSLVRATSRQRLGGRWLDTAFANGCDGLKPLDIQQGETCHPRPGRVRGSGDGVSTIGRHRPPQTGDACRSPKVPQAGPGVGGAKDACTPTGLRHRRPGECAPYLRAISSWMRSIFGSARGNRRFGAACEFLVPGSESRGGGRIAGRAATQSAG